MKIRSALNGYLAVVLLTLVGPAACGNPGDPAAVEEDGRLQSALLTAPTPDPPPASCDQRSKGVTAIQTVVRIDKYQGLIHGSNGTHEIAYGTITSTPWVYDNSIVDTSNVQLALNVKSAKDPTGLPHEIKLSVGQSVEVEGEYIPAATAHASDSKGPAAVIHFTHTPCGYVTIAGTVYH